MLSWLAQEFQSTLPRGSDVAVVTALPANRNFNPRSLAGATPCSAPPALTAGYFNPRSLAGATSHRLLSVQHRPISIHAPSRERPSHQYSLVVTYPISIHAPSRERPIVAAMITQAKQFQSTLPRGSDLQ